MIYKYVCHNCILSSLILFSIGHFFNPILFLFFRCIFKVTTLTKETCFFYLKDARKIIFISKRKVFRIFKNHLNGFDISIQNQTDSSSFKSAPFLTRMLQQWNFRELFKRNCKFFSQLVMLKTLIFVQFGNAHLAKAFSRRATHISLGSVLEWAE